MSDVYPMNKAIPPYRDLCKGDRIFTYVFGWVTVVRKSCNFVFFKMDEPIKGSRAGRVSYQRMAKHVPVPASPSSILAVETGVSRKSVREKAERKKKDKWERIFIRFRRRAERCGYTMLKEWSDRPDSFRTWVISQMMQYGYDWGDDMEEEALDGYDFVPDIDCNFAFRANRLDVGTRSINMFAHKVASPARSCIVPHAVAVLFRTVEMPISNYLVEWKKGVYIRIPMFGEKKSFRCGEMCIMAETGKILPYWKDLIIGYISDIRQKYDIDEGMVSDKLDWISDYVYYLSDSDSHVLYNMNRDGLVIKK